MDIHFKLFIGILVFFCSLQTSAKILIEGPADFKQKIQSNLAEGKNISEYLDILITAADESPKNIYIKPITDNRETWHYSGKKSRSHTDAVDNKKRGAARNQPTESVIYINVNRVTKTHKSYRSGTLIHELVHAVDFAKGLYHNDYKIREKRAIFFQNIWREYHGKSLRSDYHDRFKTLEYQNAVKHYKVDDFIQYYFEHNDTP